MKARKLMCTDVLACRQGDTMADAAKIMWERDCGIVPVVDDRKRVVGILTDRDICISAYTKGLALSQLHVKDAMQAPVHCCRDDESREAIHEMMRTHQVRRLPVVDRDARLVGMISLNDLVLSAQESTGTARSKEAEQVFETLAAVSRHRVPVLA